MSIPRIIARDPPSSVIYDLTQPAWVTVTLPVGSSWSSGLHWHETHTEYLRVIKGQVRMRLGDQILNISSADGEIKVDKNIWHEWCRAELDGEEVQIVERTDPADGEKAIFFWNLNGVLLSAQKFQRPAILPPQIFGLLLDFWISLNLFSIFYTLDNIPVLLGISDLLGKRGLSSLTRLAECVERKWSHFVLYIAAKLGSTLGIVPVRIDFTPSQEFKQWSNLKKSKAIQ